MKNTYVVILALFLTVLFANGCNDDNSVGQDGSSAFYPSITYTDETGMLLGGDENDWCYEDDTNLPPRFAMYPPYPNPFNGTTTIRFELPEACPVNISVQSSLWEFRVTIIDSYLPAGVHELEWNATDYPDGFYVCRLIAGDFECQGDLLVQRMN
jgi:hypothetical protein